MEPHATDSVNNAVYDLLGERWYTARDDPIALLRAEARLRNPWIAAHLYARHGATARLLDLGTGGGMLANWLAYRGFEVVGVDASARSLAIARHHDQSHTVKYVQGNVHELPFESGSFDAVAAMDLLEHVEQPEAVIREAARVLRPGGTFFFHTFNRNWLSWLIVIKGVEWFVRNTPANMHVLRFFIKPAELERMCAAEGLRVFECQGVAPVVFSKAFAQLLWTGTVSDAFAFKFCSSLYLGYTGAAGLAPASPLAIEQETWPLDSSLMEPVA
jgi:2-polyprenyl-6-hydroxyphenyl methylase/3-demethylubiquinone-9 3-methyltransferase